jgi:hypothetical protein
MRGNYLFAALISFVLGLLVVAVAVVYAQEWHTANQITITWDTVTTLANEAPVPESSVVGYRVWLVNAETDPDKLTPAQLPGEISEPTYTITMNTEGRYFVGVQALRMGQDGTVLGESNIVWTDNPEIVAGGATFGLQHYIPPAHPKGVSLLN